MTHVALLVARKGSQSVTRKCLRRVRGNRPLAWYALQAAFAARTVDDVWCSTDDEELGAMCERHGAKWLPRPAELAANDSPIADTLEHVLSQTECVNTLTVVAGNCGTHRDGVIDQCYQMVTDGGMDSAITGRIDNDHHPWRVKQVVDGELFPWMEIPEGASTNRQQLPPCFIADHAVWALDVQDGLRIDGQRPWRFMGRRIGYVETDYIDVHSQIDLDATEQWLAHNGHWLEAADYIPSPEDILLADGTPDDLIYSAYV